MVCEAEGFGGGMLISQASCNPMQQANERKQWVMGRTSEWSGGRSASGAGGEAAVWVRCYGGGRSDWPRRGGSRSGCPDMQLCAIRTMSRLRFWDWWAGRGENATSGSGVRATGCLG